MIIAVINRKGGVGKTTTTLNLGVALALMGFRVLVVDLDSQGNLSILLNYRDHRPSSYDVLVNEDMGLEEVVLQTHIPNLHLIPGNEDLGTLEADLNDEWGRETLLRVELDALQNMGQGYHYVLIDTPPTAGLHVGLSLVAADIAMVAFAVEELAKEGLAQVTKTIAKAKRLNPGLQQKVLLTMSDSTLSHTSGIENAVRTIFGDAVYQTVIPEQVEMKRPITGGGAVVEFAPKSAGAVAYCALAEEVARG